MKFLTLVNKQEYLKKYYPFSPVPKLTDKMICLECDEEITVADFKVKIEEDREVIVCPNAPKCDGNVSDWEKIKYRRKN